MRRKGEEEGEGGGEKERVCADSVRKSWTHHQVRECFKVFNLHNIVPTLNKHIE